MFTLKLLGGASVEGADGPLTGRVAQRRRLAALALLAMTRRQGLSREKLAAILWPDSDGDRARHLLSDTVYVINRALGGEMITAVGDELHLRIERITCDARAFEDAADRGALDEAVRLYTGPFLDGFFVEGSEEFERWTSAERERLQDLYGKTMERLAAERSRRGDLPGVVECWRRLAADDPLNSRSACRLAEALERCGDRASALQLLQAHVATLKQELGIAPPQDVASLLRTLRASPPPEPAIESAVAVVSEQAVPPPAAVAPVEPVAPARPASRRIPALAIATVVVLILLAFGLRFFRPQSTAAVTATTLQSVAVLPFADLSPARDHEYLSDGIAEELSTRLGRVPGLKVAARTSAFAFKGTETDAKSIGRALNVDALLEGSVRQSEGRVRVAVRLVDARDGYQLWAESWDRGGRDVLTMQDEIATAVLRVLRGGSSGRAAAAPRPVDPSAYNLYLQGRYYWHQRTREGLKRAAAAFDRAVLLAPAYAEAHSGVADAYAVLGFYDHLPPAEAFPRARAAARRALEIDAQLAEAHASLGYVALYYDWDWATAERELTRAIELNPSYSIGHQWLGNYLVARGRFDEAIAAMRRAQEVDPLSLIASAALGWVHYYRRDFDAAVQQCLRTLDLNANFPQAWEWGGLARSASGHHTEAATMLERAAALSERSASVIAGLAAAHASAGNVRAARVLLDELRLKHAGYLPAYDMARLHLALGEKAEALTWLGRAYDQRSHSMVFLAVDPQLDPLRSEPGFRELLVRTGVGR